MTLCVANKFFGPHAQWTGGFIVRVESARPIFGHGCRRFYPEPARFATRDARHDMLSL